MADVSPSRGIAARPLRAVIDEPAEPVLRRTVWAVAGILRRITHQDWRNMEKVPRTGGLVIVINHISNFDPVAYGHYLTWAGRWPRFLAKDAIFRVPLLGWVASHADQIRVRRHGPRANEAVAAAVQAINDGKAVSVYPEGTITADPDTWPMTGRTGAARIALATGCPVIPIAQWGAQEVLPGKKLTWPRILPRKTMRVIAGDPVPLDDLRGLPLRAPVLEEATDRILDALTALLAELREETPPPGRWDLKLGRRVPIKEWNR
ncbi:lysophospholipid acyltransferase family protein [Enemella evansiae]|uniref:1-acyl-sn-glycerol-3-phosphate acyltransferase n=1 Tax=Enemella evansiae TaxID=2016499 RepID=A0A255G0Z5_9ACTN|nr:lysophospholipid acyltransferase family protein [Enemella evansiae]PFG66904.1 1-acyl-sn-glycerol-3-phosphate acyltransferase [Propionibacteriaceae bacterium ES.041]OYO00437.1 1-acyl-sn-glycerol-3-phosphate acyltransferase [Enemella evansiae]OYO02773.1 1-acyl-sn-glycerol-3-phosphate acyltransferase [Enemella evansiae]OYO05593.1 1-acyl-sn-glycerol-3-phosphate acyltransferase [Enemella evansiae]OYO09545.1 1-acyl-sn-glycerol-3-phosphate acyltransferase [Enemella evansiae]